MTVLVTGGGGFVGLNLAEELIATGHRTVLLDRHPLPSAAEKALDCDPRPEFVVADVREPATLKRAFKDFAVQEVIHTAVITADAARESREPDVIIDVNLRGTVNVLEAARSTGCERFLYVSSGQAYGKTHDHGAVLREDISPSRPEDVYGITKLAAEQTALRLGRLWDLDVVCVRLGSVCGPWEFDTGVRDMLSPQLQVAQLAVRGQEAVLPEQEVWRDWVYSRDVAAGLVAVLDARKPSYTVYHLSSGRNWQGSFAQWCDTLKEAYPRFSWHVASNGEQPNVSYLLTRDRAPMDIGRIVHDIGFKPRFGPSEAYSDYIDWICKHQDFIAN